MEGLVGILSIDEHNVGLFRSRLYMLKVMVVGLVWSLFLTDDQIGAGEVSYIYGSTADNQNFYTIQPYPLGFRLQTDSTSVGQQPITNISTRSSHIHWASD